MYSRFTRYMAPVLTGDPPCIKVNFPPFLMMVVAFSNSPSNLSWNSLFFPSKAKNSFINRFPLVKEPSHQLTKMSVDSMGPIRLFCVFPPDTKTFLHFHFGLKASGLIIFLRVGDRFLVKSLLFLSGILLHSYVACLLP